MHGFIVTESDVWAPDYGYVWHYTDGTWEYTTYGGNAGAMPDDVFWGWDRVPTTTRSSTAMTGQGGGSGP